MSITIVCDAGSHAGKVWEVEEFRHHPVYEGDPETGWVEVRPGACPAERGIEGAA